MFCGIKSYNTCLNDVTDTGPQSLPLIYCPADDTLFEVSPEIHCSAVSIATVVMETTPLVLSQFINFLL